jgi:ferredoxin--NADP+ reductase
MQHLHQESVLSVHHWNDALFSFTTTRNPGLRFRSGHFVMLGLEVDGRPLLRAYSVASPHYAEHLEFYSIKVPDGPLTSRLCRVRPGDRVLVGRKPTGTLVLGALSPAKHLYLLATGTGLAPFMSLIRDPEVYERFERVIVVHGVRTKSELGYADYIRDELPRDELVGDAVREKLLYHPTVTREDFANRGRVTELLDKGELGAAVRLPELDPARDRVMICGSPAMLRDTVAILHRLGFSEGSNREPGDYVVERAFAEC